jgi:non-ribosomal peptide synthetase component F
VSQRGVAGREHPDLERQIGFFVNTLPLRFQFDKFMAIEQLYEVIKNETLEAFNHQLCPYDSIIAGLDLPRDISRNPLFDFLVLVRNEEDIDTGFNQVHAENNEFVKLSGQANRKARFDLTLEYVIGRNSDYLAINYKTEIFKDYQIEKVSKSLMRILELLPESWSRRIVDLDIISEEEKSFLINTVNATDATFSHNKTFLDLFVENVERTPRSLAVRFNKVELSYQELNEKSNQFAQ